METDPSLFGPTFAGAGGLSTKPTGLAPGSGADTPKENSKLLCSSVASPGMSGAAATARFQIDGSGTCSASDHLQLAGRGQSPP